MRFQIYRVTAGRLLCEPWTQQLAKTRPLHCFLLCSDVGTMPRARGLSRSPSNSCTLSLSRERPQSLRLVLGQPRPVLRMEQIEPFLEPLGCLCPVLLCDSSTRWWGPPHGQCEGSGTTRPNATASCHLCAVSKGCLDLHLYAGN